MRVYLVFSGIFRTLINIYVADLIASTVTFCPQKISVIDDRRGPKYISVLVPS